MALLTLAFLSGLAVGIGCLAFFNGRPTEVEYRTPPKRPATPIQTPE